MSDEVLKKRVVWLIDVGYVVKCAKDTFRLDYLRARTCLAKRYGLHVEVHLFNSIDPAYMPQGLRDFYDQMRLGGMHVHLYPVAHFNGQVRQKQVDVALGAHLVYFATLPHVERLVLTTGDSDMIPAVALATETLGKEVVLLTHDLGVSQALEEVVTDHAEFGEDRHAFEKTW